MNSQEVQNPTGPVSAIPLTASPWVAGLCFPEAPRWHEDALWLSDMYDRKVLRIDEEGKVSTVLELATQPSGLGWRPDGTLLVVSMEDRRLLQVHGSFPHIVADLTALASFHCNDMLVDHAGRAYIGNFGFDFMAGEPVRPARLVMVNQAGQCKPVADDLQFPNGMALTPDGRTLIVAETWANRLTAFSVDAQGALSERRVWANVGPAAPDGICLDQEHAIWMASPGTREVIRVIEGGAITHRIQLDRSGIACMLGGKDGRTLFVLSAPLTRPEKGRALRAGRVDTVRVDVPGAGLP